MNRNRMAMCLTCAASAFVCAILGWLVFSAWTEIGELSGNLESAKSSAQRELSAKTAPTAGAEAAIKANIAAVKEWYDDAFALAAQGDANFSKHLSPERFKQKMVAEAREMMKPRSPAEGPIAKEGFGFGMGDYISGGAMPDARQLPELRRRWFDVKTIGDSLAFSSVTEILDISVEEPEASRPKETEKRGKNRKQAKKAAPRWTDSVSARTYTVRFLAKPMSLVRVCNAIAMGKRVIVVDSYSFAKDRDTLAEKLAGDKERLAGGRQKKGATARPRLPAGAGEAEKDSTGLVTDPSLEPPFTVTARLTTYDFGTSPESGTDAMEEEMQ